MSRTILVLGGARSGKSRFAEGIAAGHQGEKTYLATSEIFDDETRLRIDRHVAQRGAGWQTVEEPLDLSGALERLAGTNSFVLVECVTIWINNLMHHDRDVAAHVTRLCEVLAKMQGTLVLVSNEVGLGIVPDNALARRFRDEAGRANQLIAEAAGEVYFVAAGLPMALKK